MAFTVLMIALIPLSYLFTTSLIQAGQAKNQQTALSIAEKWAEIGSNITPPVNCNGEVVVDQSVPPVSPNAAATTIASTTANTNLATQTTVKVASTSAFAAAPQSALIATSTGLQLVNYTAMTGTTFTIAANSGTGLISNGCPVTQPTASELRGNTTYSLKAEYEWTTVQNAGNGSTTVTTAVNSSNPSTVTSLTVASTASFAAASTASPQPAVVTTTSGAVQTITYTGSTATTLIGITGWTVSQLNISVNAHVAQELKPNLCAAGTPQLLKLRMTVGWGPNSDANNAQDSIILNYPPAGIQTLGFIALQLTGDTTALDYQDNPWNIRVQAPPVTISGPQSLTIYPDNYGCAFAQVLPTSVGNTYTVSVGNASSGTPSGSTYGTPSFVANGAGSVGANHVLQQPLAESQAGIPVNIGAVTKLAGTYPTAYPGYDQGSIVNLSYPSSSAVEDGVICPGVGQITCISTGESNSGAVLTWSNQSTWSNVTLPAPATRITSVACAGAVECEGVGYNLVGGVSSPGHHRREPVHSLHCHSQHRHRAVRSPVPVSDRVPLGRQLRGHRNHGHWRRRALRHHLRWRCRLVGGRPHRRQHHRAHQPGLPGIGGGMCCPRHDQRTSRRDAGHGVRRIRPGLVIQFPQPHRRHHGIGFVIGMSVQYQLHRLLGHRSGPGRRRRQRTDSDLGSRPAGLGTATPAWTWTADSFPSGTTVTSLTGLNCPQPSKCLLTGVGTIGAGSVPLVMYGATTATATLANDTLPAAASGAITSITQMTCPSSGVCVMIGTTATAPAFSPAPLRRPTWLTPGPTSPSRRLPLAHPWPSCLS